MHETMRSPYETVVWEEGRCAAAREMLLGILTARFGPCDDATVQAIQALSDGSELMRLAQRAIHVGSLADLRREVGRSPDAPTA